MITVDDDGTASATDCDATDEMAYSSIQDAIDAAVAGDTVQVCPGNYREWLSIDATKDRLSLISVGMYKARLIRPRHVSSDSGALIHIQHGANHVLIKGLSLIFPTRHDDCEGAPVAIAIDGQNASIRGNRIFSRGGDPDFSSCGYAFGVAVGDEVTDAASLATGAWGRSARARAAETVLPAGSPKASAFIGWNIVRDFQYFGIIANGAQTTIEATGNSVHYGHVGATFCPGVNTASSAGPRWFRPADSPPLCLAFGILLLDQSAGTITDNAIVSDFDLGSASAPAGGFQPLLGVGIGTNFGSSAGEFTILRNTVAFTTIGIQAGTTQTGLVHNNQVAYSVQSLIDAISTGLTVTGNSLSYGNLIAESSSSGDLFRNNTVTSGSCTDNSTGSGTGGTANTWKKNTAEFGSTPPEICPEPASVQN